MEKGDLVKYEFLTRHPSGVGWEFHKGIGFIVEYDSKSDSYKIMTKYGHLIERLDMQLELISREYVDVEKNEG